MNGGHGRLIGGRPFDPARPMAPPARATWKCGASSPTSTNHPIHPHLVGFRVLTRGGKPPPPHDAGLKDTASPRPGESAEIITHFDGYRGVTSSTATTPNTTTWA